MFFVLYGLCALLSGRAVIPAIAFILTLSLSFINIPPIYLHSIYAAVYLLLIPASSIKVAWLMLCSSGVNALAIYYFLSPFYFDAFVLTFSTIMIVLNWGILFTIFKGIKGGESYNVSGSTSDRVMDIFNLPTFKKES